MRVDVWSGDGETNLGQGTLVGYGRVYTWWGLNGELVSEHDAGKCPGRLRRFWCRMVGRPVTRTESNPIIVLDSGRTVYGCQVWWTPVSEEEKGAKA
jgi:hypothetical protein